MQKEDGFVVTNRSFSIKNAVKDILCLHAKVLVLQHTGM